MLHSNRDGRNQEFIYKKTGAYLHISIATCSTPSKSCRIDTKNRCVGGLLEVSLGGYVCFVELDFWTPCSYHRFLEKLKGC